MTFPGYLALTAAEFAACKALPAHPAWMACHYACYGTGLSNCPVSLPEEAMLIVNDRTPPAGHDIMRIKEQLAQLVEDLKISCVLLDLQRPEYPENTALAIAAQDLPCTVGVSALYAKDLYCPVFLPPAPINKPLYEYLNPWKNRPIWLETELYATSFTLAQTGCTKSICTEIPQENANTFRCEKSHCHYCTEEEPDKIHFTLWRTMQDFTAILQETETFGVEKIIALYQELEKTF